MRFHIFPLLDEGTGHFSMVEKQWYSPRTCIQQEGRMDKVRGFGKLRRRAEIPVILAICVIAVGGWLVQAKPVHGADADTALIADFRRVEVASVSDAAEQLLGKRVYLSHRMQPILTAK